MKPQGAMSLLKRFGPTCFGLILLLGALYVVQREFRGLSWQDIQTALHATPPASLWLAAGCAIGAYLLLSAYDRLGSIYAGHPVSWRRSLLASFCAYSLANNIGFATVSGAAVRYRFYASWGLAPVAIAKVIAITSLTFGLGGFAIAGLVLVLEPDLLTFLGPGAPRWILPLLGFFCWAIVVTYVVLARFVPHIRLFGHQIDLPGFRIALAQVALATTDVAVTAMIFFALLPPAEGLGFLHFLGIYIAAYMAGLAANVPGGIGVFDGAILFALAGFMPTPVVVGALLLFRLFYYIIPLFLAGALFAGFEVSQRRKLVGRLAPDRGIAVSFEVPALAGLTGLAALVLIFIGALPPKPSLLGPMPDFLEDAASHFAASVVGSLLLAAAYGLVRRLTIAWWGSLFLLLNGALILVLRGEPLWLIAAFLVVPLLLTTARGAFYRHAWCWRRMRRIRSVLRWRWPRCCCWSRPFGCCCRRARPCWPIRKRHGKDFWPWAPWRLRLRPPMGQCLARRAARVSPFSSGMGFGWRLAIRRARRGTGFPPFGASATYAKLPRLTRPSGVLGRNYSAFTVISG